MRRARYPWPSPGTSPSDGQRGGEVELDVGRVQPVAGAHEPAGLGHVRGQRSAALVSNSAQVLRRLSAPNSDVLLGRSRMTRRRSGGLGGCSPTPGTSATTSIRAPRARRGRPMPDSISSCGELYAPAHTITSRSARSSSMLAEPHRRRRRPRACPRTARDGACTCVSTVRFGRSITGCRYATAVLAQRRPLRWVIWYQPTPVLLARR